MIRPRATVGAGLRRLPLTPDASFTHGGADHQDGTERRSRQRGFRKQRIFSEGIPTRTAQIAQIAKLTLTMDKGSMGVAPSTERD